MLFIRLTSHTLLRAIFFRSDNFGWMAALAQSQVKSLSYNFSYIYIVVDDNKTRPICFVSQKWIFRLDFHKGYSMQQTWILIKLKRKLFIAFLNEFSCKIICNRYIMMERCEALCIRNVDDFERKINLLLRNEYARKSRLTITYFSSFYRSNDKRTNEWK